MVMLYSTNMYQKDFTELKGETFELKILPRMTYDLTMELIGKKSREAIPSMYRLTGEFNIFQNITDLFLQMEFEIERLMKGDQYLLWKI